MFYFLDLALSNRILLYARITLELVQQMGAKALDQPLHILPFILNALEQGKDEVVKSNQSNNQTSMHEILETVDLLNRSPSDHPDDNDSDDEGDTEYVETALNLLLSLLEGEQCELLQTLGQPCISS